MFKDHVKLVVQKQLLSPPSGLHRFFSLLVFVSGEAVLFQKIRENMDCWKKSSMAGKCRVINDGKSL